MRAENVSGLCLLLIAGVLCGCAASGPEIADIEPHRRGAAARETAPAERAARIARQQVGVRYRYGGASPTSGFDCSGLVHYSFSQAGVSVPRTSREMFRAATKIALAEAEPGDVVFFQDQAKLSHVGIYLGERRFVHAPSSGKTVTVAHIDAPYYQQHLVAVGRLDAL